MSKWDEMGRPPGNVAKPLIAFCLAAIVIAYSVVGMTGALDRPGTDDGCVLVAEFCEESGR